jgi:hypothetical protein
MAITSSDILIKLSVKTGSAGDTTAGTPAGSLGKYISTTEVSGTALNNIFDDVTGQENFDSDTEYRCIFVHNNHATLTLQNAVVYISAQVAGGAAAAIAVDSVASSAVGSSSAQALEVATENDAPAAISFSAPTTRGTGLSLGNIAAGSVKAFWIRRLANNTSALDNDGLTFVVSGDTAA